MGHLGDVSSTSIEASLEAGEAHIIRTTVIERNTSVAESMVSCDFFHFLFSIFVLPKDQNIIKCLVIYTTGFCIFCIPVKDQNIILCYEKYRHCCIKTHSSLEKSSGCRPKHTYISYFSVCRSVFTRKNIRRGEFICKYDGKLCSYGVLWIKQKEYEKLGAGSYILEFKFKEK